MPAATPTKVLVIDDEVKFCGLLQAFLSGRGHAVATASSGNEALAQLGQFRPDVVLLDVVMPGLSGLELLQLIRDRAFPPRVIMVTAKDDEDTTQQAMRLGAEAFVCKPVNFEMLERLISRIWPPQPPSPTA